MRSCRMYEQGIYVRIMITPYVLPSARMRLLPVLYVVDNLLFPYMSRSNIINNPSSMVLYTTIGHTPMFVEDTIEMQTVNDSWRHLKHKVNAYI